MLLIKMRAHVILICVIVLAYSLTLALNVNMVGASTAQSKLLVTLKQLSINTN